MKISRKRLKTIIKEEVKKVIVETSYQDFIDNYGSELRDASKKVKKFQAIDWSNFTEDEVKNIRFHIESALRPYDEYVAEWIDNVIGGYHGARPPEVRDIAKVAVQNYNMNGTDKNMVIDAINDAYKALRSKGVL